MEKMSPGTKDTRNITNSTKEKVSLHLLESSREAVQETEYLAKKGVNCDCFASSILPICVFMAASILCLKFQAYPIKVKEPLC